VLASLVAGEISEGHARALLGLPDAAATLAAWQAVLDGDLSVRRTEELVRRLRDEGATDTATDAAPARRARTPDPVLADIEERLQRTLGTK
jgi:ParB family chromosome partitioning protein